MTDVIVAGLGAMGSAALYHMARSGLRVIGIDQFQPPHELGSSHGHTRIIREAYFEHPLYVPLVRRAHQLWDELGRLAGEPLYLETGGLMLGPRDGPLVAGSYESAVQHQVAHQLLSAEEVRRRWPGFTPPDDFVGLLEEHAGALFPERAIAAHLRLAQAAGAELKTGVRVMGWTSANGGIQVETTAGTIAARQLVLAVGAWLPKLLAPSERDSFTVERQTFHWFYPYRGQPLSAADTPVVLVEPAAGRQVWMIPDLGDGIKAGIHHEGPAADPDTIDRTTTPDEEQRLRAILARYLPGANGALRRTSVCLYTNTRDRHFVVDRLPADPAVLLLSPCSGHGFKFSSVVGEIAADLVQTGRSRFDLSPFAFSRLRS